MKSKIVLVIAIISIIGLAFFLVERLTPSKAIKTVAKPNPVIKPTASYLKILAAEHSDYNQIRVSVENGNSTTVKKFNASVAIYFLTEDFTNKETLVYNEKHTFYLNAAKGEIKTCSTYLAKTLPVHLSRVEITPLDVIEW